MTTWSGPPSSAGITPNRVATLSLDIDETVMVEQGLTVLRTGADVARRSAEGTANDSEHVNLRFISSGCWIPDFVQTDMANLHESTIGSSLILTLSNFVTIATNAASGAVSMLQQMANFAQSTIAGASYGSGVPSTGDIFLRKRIPATGSTDPAALSANASFDSARPALPYQADVPMDRVAVSSTTYAANQGYFLRWRTPGTTLSPLRYMFGFHFGQYCITLKGSGSAEVWEYCFPATGSERWVKRAAWRFTQEAQAAGAACSMAIYPHMAPDGSRYIAFTNLASATSPRVNTGTRVDITNTVASEHIYRIDQTVRGSDIDVAPGHATSSDKIRIDIRRDLKLDFQVSILGFQTSGTLIDDDSMNGGGSATGNTNPVNCYMMAVTPAGTSITPTVIDGATQAALVPGTDLFPAAKFAFAGTATAAPSLWGYSLLQSPVVETVSPGSFSLHGTSYSIDGYAGDPQTESATIEAFDPTMTHTRLTKRGRFSARLHTTYTPPAADPVTVALFDGICITPRSIQVGTSLATSAVAKFRHYSLPIVGMWDRLHERVQPPALRVYAIDPSVVTGGGGVVPWKVTDAVVDMLLACGFTGSQVNIPDLNYRLWQGYSQKGDDYQINPAASYAEMIVRMLRERLGCYLYWEPNAGASGQWILLFGTQPGMGGTFTPVYNFVSDQITTPGKGPYAPGSYPDNTSFIVSQPEYSVRRPDFNMIHISTGISTTTCDTQMAVQAFAYNYLSYAVPGSAVTVDPEYPDYIGHCVPYQLIAPQLVVPGDYAGTTAAVRWTCRRYYDFLCHAQRICHFKAPLALIYDSRIASGASGGWRPLRFQDPISIDGSNTWLIKSCHPSWDQDSVMMCEYEAIQPFPGQMFYGFDGVEHHRTEQRRSQQRNSGHASRSALHGLTAPSPHKEQAHLELPVVRQGFAALQDNTGAFYPIAGWNTFDGSSG